MSGLCRSLRFRRRVAYLPVILLVAVVSCSGDDRPPVAQAANALRSHVLGVLKERSAIDVKIVDAGGVNHPCGDGEAKQTFAATGKDGVGSASAEALNTMLIGALGRVAQYRVVSANPPGQPILLVDEATRTRLTLKSPGNAVYAVSGETECLPIGD